VQAHAPVADVLFVPKVLALVSCKLQRRRGRELQRGGCEGSVHGVQGLNRRGSFLHGTLTQWFPTQKSPSFLHVPEDASMGTASRCSTIVFAPAVSASIECTISLRFVCVLTSATIKSAPPVMFFPQIFPKMVSTQLFASERNAKACEVIDEVSRSSFTPEVHTSTLFCVAAPPLSRRAHLRGEQGAVMSTCMRVRGVCYRIWGGVIRIRILMYPACILMYPDVSQTYLTCSVTFEENSEYMY